MLEYVCKAYKAGNSTKSDEGDSITICTFSRPFNAILASNLSDSEPSKEIYTCSTSLINPEDSINFTSSLSMSNPWPQVPEPFFFLNTPTIYKNICKYVNMYIYIYIYIYIYSILESKRKVLN